MGKDKGAWSDAFQSACEEPTSLAFQELDVKNCVLQQHDLINFPFAASSDDVSQGSKGRFLSVVLGCGVLGGFGSSHLVQRGCAGVCGATLPWLAFPGVLETLIEPIITHLLVCKAVVKVFKTWTTSKLPSVAEPQAGENIYRQGSGSLQSPPHFSLPSNLYSPYWWLSISLTCYLWHSNCL